MAEETAVSPIAHAKEVAVTAQGIQIRNMDDLRTFAHYVVKSGLSPTVGSGSKKRAMKGEEVLIATIAGMELGLPPMQSLQSIAVFNGRPTLWGDSMKGLVEASGLCESFAETVDGEGDDMIATCTVSRKGRDEPVTQTFSVADARAAGLLGKAGPWTNYRRRMLQLRARSWACRDAFPDVLKGLMMAEEARDIPIDVTPSDSEAAEPVDSLDVWTEKANELEAPKPEPEPEPEEPEAPEPVGPCPSCGEPIGNEGLMKIDEKDYCEACGPQPDPLSPAEPADDN